MEVDSLITLCAGGRRAVSEEAEESAGAVLDSSYVHGHSEAYRREGGW